MDSNINTQHTLLCTIFATKSQEGFNPKPPHSIVAVALDMSKAFDTVNIHKLTLTFLTSSSSS